MPKTDFSKRKYKPRRPKHDLIGQKIGRLTVLSLSHYDSENEIHWVCLCSCGTLSYPKTYHLRDGQTTSCGCLHYERITTHGMTGTRLFTLYNAMLARCHNPRSKNYAYYGARGIKVCPKWCDAQIFFRWALSNGYDDNLTIDRIDNSKGYTPENCRWVTAKVNQNNRTNNRRITVKGVTRTLTEWADLRGITSTTLACRINRGWSEEEAVQYNSLRPEITARSKRKV